jgi:hypothetical protein
VERLTEAEAAALYRLIEGVRSSAEQAGRRKFARLF